MERIHAVCSAGISLTGSYAWRISGDPKSEANSAYLGVKWDVLAGNQQGNDNGNPSQQGDLGPDEPAFSPIDRREVKGQRRPDVAVGKDAPSNDENEAEMSCRPCSDRGLCGYGSECQER